MAESDFASVLNGPNQEAPAKKWQSWLNWFLSLLGLLAVVYGLFSLYLGQDQLECPPLQAAEADQSQIGQLYVDLSGGVEEPGVYVLPANSRISAALAAAGGLSPAADPAFVTTQLNLAEKLRDGQKLHIKTQAEADYEQSLNELCQQQAAQSTTAKTTTDKTSINRASAAELTELPQIGEKRSEDIINGRPYQSLNELIEREILTETIFSKLKDQLEL